MAMYHQHYHQDPGTATTKVIGQSGTTETLMTVLANHISR